MGLTGVGRRGWGGVHTSRLGTGRIPVPSGGGDLSIGAPKGLWPCPPALPRPARQSLSFSLLPAGLPALDANDPEGESVSSTRLTPKFSPRTLASWLLSWIHVLFFLSLQIKTALSTMVRACAPLMAVPHLHPLPPFCVRGPTQLGWGSDVRETGARIGRGKEGETLNSHHSRMKERATPVWFLGRFSSGRTGAHGKPGQFTKSRCYGSNQLLGGGSLCKNCLEEGSYWVASLLLLTHSRHTPTPGPLYLPIPLPRPLHPLGALLREALPDQSP